MSAVATDPEPLALDELGWRQFLDLCAAVLELRAGVAPSAWTDENDRNWHADLTGAVRLGPGPELPAPCRVRAVWIPDRKGGRRASALEHELLNIRGEVADSDDSVLVLTNFAGVFSDSSRLRSVLGRDRCVLYGPGRISRLIDADPRLRRAMPSLLSLGDLERWVPAEPAGRSTLDLPAARELARVFVPTAAYRRALAVLDVHRFAVLTGPPEMGKTSIARMVALALMSDGWEAHECTVPEQVFSALHRDRAQVFVADDAFGSTEYRPDAAERWAREMERLLRVMDARHWLIWTSRPAPLRAGLGRIHRERGAERFPRPGEILVDASHLSLDEKALILLRHARPAWPGALRRELRQLSYEIVAHPHFTPERIRRLVHTSPSVLLGRGDGGVAAVVERLITTPTEAMAASFGALSSEHQALLFALLDAPVGPVEERDVARLARLHHPDGLSRPPLELVDRLTDHFLRVTDTLKVDWVHPSWRDVVIERLRTDGPARAAFLQRCTIDGLLLAVSIAGGPTGGRDLPLLIEDRDWDLLSDGVARTVREASGRDLVRLLDALANAIGSVIAAEEPRDRRELVAVAELALTATTRRCDRCAEPLDVDLIAAWFGLDEAAGVGAGAPRLDRTWTELLPCETVDLTVASERDAAVAWLRLVDLLRRYAPDALERYGFPGRHRERIRELVRRAEAAGAGERPAVGAGMLAPLVKLCRRYVGGEPDMALLDRLLWDAAHVGEPAQAPEPIVFPDSSARHHVERILDDL